MPSTYAHYVFGRRLLSMYPEPLAAQIRAARPLFDIGVHGPDLLFYFKPLFSNAVNSIGYSMHGRPASEFFGPAKEVYQRAENKRESLAYLMGFVSHFALDSACHGYIEHKIAVSGVTHTEIESEFDRSLLLAQGIEPLSARLTGHIVPSAENAAAMTPEVGVVTLSPGSVNVLSELPGRTVPYEVAEIRPQVGGIIIKRNFIEGDKVNQGDSLYQIDPAPLQAELNSAKGSLAKALSTASNARITFNRQASLLKTNYVSRQDYDTARTQLNEAEANVTVAKAAVEQATINLQYANVTSPITGVSGKSSVTVGALVTANQADSLVTVQRLDPIYVDLTQSVQDFLRMKEEVASGQIKQVQGSTPVQLNLENGKRYSQTGTLKFSDPTVDETTGSVTLRAIFPNPNGDLLPGMYVTALVDEGSRQNVLLVPQEGVTHNAQGKATALILDKDDVVQLREIEASKAIGDQWVVTSGLQAGDRVIVSGLQRIRPGIKARAISSSQENASTESKQ